MTTTAATTPDAPTLPMIQANLAARELVPREQIVDSAYMAADHLVSSQTEHGIDLLGPVTDDQSWQARAGAGFAIAQFAIDWDKQQALCPQGNTSVQWLVRHDQQNAGLIQIGFAPADCAACAVRSQCTHSDKHPRRLTVQAREQYEALQHARQRQHTEAFKTSYAQRAA